MGKRKTDASEGPLVNEMGFIFTGGGTLHHCDSEKGLIGDKKIGVYF